MLRLAPFELPRAPDWRKRLLAIHQMFTRWRYTEPTMSNDTMADLLAGSRLDALIHAAGRVEHSGIELVVLLERLQQPASEAIALERGPGFTLRPGELVELRATVNAVMAADWHVHNLLWWTRTLIGRLEHKTKLKGGRYQQNGLLTFLGSDDEAAVIDAMRLLRDRWKHDVTTLTDYSLHFESVLLEPKQLRWDGQRWQLPLADRQSSRIDPFANLNYNRDCEGFGRALLEDVRVFVEEILRIFEMRQERRFEARPSQQASKPAD